MADDNDLMRAAYGYAPTGYADNNAFAPYLYGSQDEALAATDDKARAWYDKPIVRGQPVYDAMMQTGESPIMHDIYGLYHSLNPWAEATPRDAATQAAYSTPVVGEALSGKDAYNALVNKDYLGAGLAGLGALPLVGGMFAGEKSLTANIAKLREATAMHEAGHDATSIWNQTGWFQGADGKWRYEIPDDKMQLRHTLDELGTSNPRPLDTVFDHDKLYGAYPEVANTNWYLTPEMKQGQGSFSPTQGIRLGNGEGFASGINGPAGMTLHEAQHAVQNLEGTARGGSMMGEYIDPYAAKLKAERDANWDAQKADINKRRSAIINEVGKPFDIFSATPEQKSALQSLKAEEDAARAKAFDFDPDYEAYKRLAGEVEARNVQARMNMSPEERLANPPWTTQDVPNEQQIVRFGSNGPAMSTGDNPLTRNYHGYEVRPMDTEDLHEIGQANYAGPYTIDPVQSMPLSQLSGSAFRQDKVGPLADKIKANGWLEPIVVDGSGNIIEGQHRFRALQQLGVPDAPVHRIREAVSPDVYYSIRDAAASGQKMHQDHAGQIANQIAEIIGEEGPQALHEYEAPRGFEKGWAAAVQAAQKAHGLSTGDNPLMKSAPNPFDFSNPGGGTRTAQVGNTEITYGVGKNGDAELTLIKTPEGLRGQGSGRAAMQQFLNEADRNGYRVLLNADPMGKGVSKNKLVDFYKSFGFKRNAGNKRDFTTRAEFIRDPKSAE